MEAENSPSALNFRSIALSLLVAFVVSIPYLYGFLLADAERPYTGIRSLNASDFNQNVSFIQQSMEGRFFISNEFTSVKHKPMSLRPVYFLLSAPFRLIQFRPPVIFHLLRIIAGIILLLCLWKLFAWFGMESRASLIAFLLLCFSSGAGWLAKSFGYSSIDTAVPESTLFLALGEAPHFLTSLLLFWAGMAAFYRGSVLKPITMLAIFYLCMNILWWDHPFEAVLLVMLSSILLFFYKSWKHRVAILVLNGAFSLLPFIYYSRLKTAAGYTGWGSDQNLMTSPSPVALFSGLILLVAVAIPGLRAALRSERYRRPAIYVSVWFVLQLVLLYAPFPFQRRLISGIQFPLAILAAIYFASIRNARAQFLAPLVFILFSSITNLTLFAGDIKTLSGKSMPYFLPPGYEEAFAALRRTNDRGAVLSGFTTGNFIPAYTRHFSYMGHSSLTPDIARRRFDAGRYFRTPDPEWARNNNIRYVFYGLEEKSQYARGFNPPLRVYFRNPVATIYEIP